MSIKSVHVTARGGDEMSCLVVISPLWTHPSPLADIPAGVLVPDNPLWLFLSPAAQ